MTVINIVEINDFEINDFRNYLKLQHNVNAIGSVTTSTYCLVQVVGMSGSFQLSSKE